MQRTTKQGCGWGFTKTSMASGGGWMEAQWNLQTGYQVREQDDILVQNHTTVFHLQQLQ